jgi:hypothetical protein
MKKFVGRKVIFGRKNSSTKKGSREEINYFD